MMAFFRAVVSSVTPSPTAPKSLTFNVAVGVVPFARVVLLNYLLPRDVLKALPASQAGVFLYIEPLVAMAEAGLSCNT